jgi:hypothetical protein
MSLELEQCLDLRPLPPTYRQPVRDAIENHLPVRFRVTCVRRAFHAGHRGAGNEAVAMDAQKAFAELGLQMHQ